MRILLVEDNPFLLGVFREIMEAFGHEVLEASAGPDALALIREGQQAIDLVVNDLVMVDMNAMELYEAILAYQEGVKMLVVTSYPMPQTGASLLARPEVRWLNKPVSMEQFEEALRKMVAA